MLIYTTTPLEFIAGALTLIGVGVCIGYIACDIHDREADRP